MHPVPAGLASAGVAAGPGTILSATPPPGRIKDIWLPSVSDAAPGTLARHACRGLHGGRRLPARRRTHQNCTLCSTVQVGEYGRVVP